MTSGEFSEQWNEGTRESPEIKYDEDTKPPKAEPPTSFQVAPRVPRRDGRRHPSRQPPPSSPAAGRSRRGRQVTAELIAFLRDRKADEERVALAASNYGDTWTARDPGVYPSDESRHPGPIIGGIWGDLEDEYAAHISRWDPGSVLAKVRADRRVLDEIEQHIGAKADVGGWRAEGWIAGFDQVLTNILLAMVQPYVGYDGFRDAWKESV